MSEPSRTEIMNNLRTRIDQCDDGLIEVSVRASDLRRALELLEGDGKRIVEEAEREDRLRENEKLYCDHENECSRNRYQHSRFCYFHR